MSISVIKYIKKYFIFSLLVLFFGYIYELFSHNVYSVYMQFAFVIPLVLGLLVFCIMNVFKKELMKNTGLTLYNNGVITLTIWSILKGVLEIYGTTNYLLDIFLYESLLLFIISILIIIFNIFKERYVI